ncbi:MAG: methyltransferase domain-containing protein [Sphingobacteriia bacterium]|jgi:uncharacterized membrane protein (GlpM family)
MQQLQYTPTERIQVPSPVTRIKYITEACTNKTVLDLGCYDETALIKNNTETYLFAAIDAVAKNHIGIDNSSLLPEEGIRFTPTSRIIKGDIRSLKETNINPAEIEILIAGELIEHIPNTLDFFKLIKSEFANKKIICSTPNTTSLSNIILALFKRESCHIDHYQVYSYKTLNTLCRTAGFSNWKIIPYHVKYTEMILRSKGIKKIIVQGCEKIINLLEYIFPLTGGGFIIDIDI